MKIITFLVFLSANLLSQNDVLNNQKYWRYRTELRNRFLKVGDCMGCSLPADRIYDNNWNTVTMGWGDSMGNLGWYLSILATENYLLRQHFLDDEINVRVKPLIENERELYFALKEIDNLDILAECIWSNNSDFYYYNNTNDPNHLNDEDVPYCDYWDETNEVFICGTMGYDLNGFCLRQNIPPNFYENFQGISNSNIPEKSVIDDRFQIITEESQDNLIDLLMGLVFIKRYVEEDVNYQGINLVNYAETITNRLLNAYDGFWNLRNPANNNEIAGWQGKSAGVSCWNSYNLALIGDYMVHDRLPVFANSSITFPEFEIIIGLSPTFHSPITFLSKNLFVRSSISQYLAGFPSNNEEEAAFVKLMFYQYLQSVLFPQLLILNFPATLTNIIYSPQWTTEHSMKLMILASVAASDGWRTINPAPLNLNTSPELIWNAGFEKNQIYYLINKALWAPNHLTDSWNKTDIKAMINSAPCEGPFSYLGNNQTEAGDGWNKTNRFIVKDRIVCEYPGQEGCDGNTFDGEYAGMDYMLLFNLYCILYPEEITTNYTDFMNAYFHGSFPTQNPFYGGSSGSVFSTMEGYNIPFYQETLGDENNPFTVFGFETLDLGDIQVGNSNGAANVIFKARNEINTTGIFDVDANSNWETILSNDFICTNGNYNRLANPDSSNGITNIRNAALSIREDHNRFEKILKEAEYQTIQSLMATNSTHFTLWPNPTKESINFQLNSNHTDLLNISITDLSGKCVINTVQYSKDNSLNSYVLNLESLKAGMYFCHFKFESETMTEKIIKVN